MNIINLTRCPCGLNQNYTDCCQSFHNGIHFPITAEALMRSRYSAYVLKNADYLLATWHKTTCPKQLDFSQDNTTWQKLEILHTKKGGAKDEKGRVEFNAFYVQDSETRLMHEISRFKKVAGRWFYVNGVLN
ncbi:MAG: YchJ family protein [Methylococcales bacterium]|nr:YchJ family protein [Methylococcales bacterium]MDD5754802.1 YchJ family protein [Methylococcales bacterium]